MNRKLANAVSFTCATMMIFAAGCSSVPKEIPANMPLEELKQNAYQCETQENYKGAAKYISTIIERYGTNLSVMVAAEFEMGHLYIKQKKYNTAKPYLERVLSYAEYDTTNSNSQYYKLAAMDLDKIKAAQEAKAKKESKSKKTNKSKAPKE